MQCRGISLPMLACVKENIHGEAIRVGSFRRKMIGVNAMILFKWQTTIIQRNVTFLCGKTALDYAENMYQRTHPYFNYELARQIPSTLCNI